MNSLGYTKQWSNYRFRFLHHNPACYACGGKSSVVDHIQAFKGDMSLFWKVDNYMPLCKPCHDYVTGKFDMHTPPRTQEKLKWITEKRAKLGVMTKVKITPFKGENITS